MTTACTERGPTARVFADARLRLAAEEDAGVGSAIVKYEKYPPSDLFPRGFLSPPVEETLPEGTVISRYGSPYGTFASPEDTTFSARGLPPEYESYGESLYQLQEPLKVNAGIAAYWQGGGFGVQYELPESVQSLLNSQVLKEYSP